MNPSDHFFGRKKGSKHEKRKSYISKAEKRLNSHPSRCGIFKPACDRARGWFHQMVPASEGPSRRAELAGAPASSTRTGGSCQGPRAAGDDRPGTSSSTLPSSRRGGAARPCQSRAGGARVGRDTAGHSAHGGSRGRTRLLLSFKKTRLCRGLPPVQQKKHLEGPQACDAAPS